jgi:ubiquinone/menaquinone biosynthesis C-methylase UbiE
MEQHEYDLMYELENIHWWFLGKRKFITTVFPKVKKVKILDIGAGTGGTTKFLKIYGEVVGLEANPLAQTFARKRGLKIVSGTAEKLPFDKEKFDIVTIFDVLYHQNIGSDLKVLQEAHRVLKPQGYLVITDCALPFLKSPHDEVMQARERYTKIELTEKIEKAGFRVEKASYVFFLVFPLTLFKRLLDRITKSHSSNVSPVPKLLNSCLLGICTLEAWCLKIVAFPWGSSVIIRAKKGSLDVKLG